MGQEIEAQAEAQPAAPRPQMTVYTLTIEGDNQPMETNVYTSADAARADLIEWLTRYGVGRGKDGFKMSEQSVDELCDLWTEAAGGPCIFDAHQIDTA